MKKLLLIVLIVCMYVSIVFVSNVLAKAEWDGWKESLPPFENKGWDDGPIGLKVITFGDNERVFSVRDFHFGATSIIFYFPRSQEADLLKNIIPDPKFARFAVVAHSPKKKKVAIGVYEYEIEDSVFKFIGEWEVPFKNGQDVVTNEKFCERFTEWLKKQFAEIGKVIPVEKEKQTAEFFLPKLMIDKKDFRLECWPQP